MRREPWGRGGRFEARNGQQKRRIRAPRRCHSVLAGTFVIKPVRACANERRREQLRTRRARQNKNVPRAPETLLGDCEGESEQLAAGGVVDGVCSPLSISKAQYSPLKDDSKTVSP